MIFMVLEKMLYSTKINGFIFRKKYHNTENKLNNILSSIV